MFATKQSLQQGNRSKPRFRLPESRPSPGVIQRCSPEEVKREAFTIYEKRKDKASGYNADGDYFLAQSILRPKEWQRQNTYPNFRAKCKEIMSHLSMVRSRIE